MARLTFLADSFYSVLLKNHFIKRFKQTLCPTLFCHQKKLIKTMNQQNPPKVYVTRRVPKRGVDLLRQSCEVHQWDKEDHQAELQAKNASASGIANLIHSHNNQKRPSLKAISTMSVGYDHIDLLECMKRNIPVGFTPNVLTDATAELTVALLLTTSRRLVEGASAVKDGLWGTWNPIWMCGAGLANSTVGIIGMGRIGMAVSRRLRPFGVARILYSDQNPMECASEVGAEYASLDDLLKQSDFVIGTCALTPETTGLFNKEAFKKMKNSAIFVNTSRGGLVNQEDLYEALSMGEIASAGLDVTSPEPLPTDHPLLSLTNCVILPHIGSATVETRAMMSELAAQNILAVFNGQPMPEEVQV